MPGSGKIVLVMPDGEVPSQCYWSLTCANGDLDRNLMAKDEFKNLGFSEDPAVDTKKEDTEKGVKGELRW